MKVEEPRSLTSDPDGYGIPSARSVNEPAYRARSGSLNVAFGLLLLFSFAVPWTSLTAGAVVAGAVLLCGLATLVGLMLSSAVLFASGLPTDEVRGLRIERFGLALGEHRIPASELDSYAVHTGGGWGAPYLILTTKEGVWRLWLSASAREAEVRWVDKEIGAMLDRWQVASHGDTAPINELLGRASGPGRKAVYAKDH
ncbi:MAG: hypothetical protein AAGA48_30025 [Myxococcota bacterium]